MRRGPVLVLQVPHTPHLLLTSDAPSSLPSHTSPTLCTFHKFAQELNEVAELQSRRQFHSLMIEARHLTDQVEALLANPADAEGPDPEAELQQLREKRAIPAKA